MGESRADMTKDSSTFSGPVQVYNPTGVSPVLLVCEHASNYMPAEYSNLGLDADARLSHVAWDPGAMAVATRLSKLMGSTLVAGCVSRLIYDCNRPPEAEAAMPTRSELFDIPGNSDIGAAERARRIAEVYEPFRDTLAATVAAQQSDSILVTIHSFTPVYMGMTRSVELGILHDSDSRMADAMLDLSKKHTDLNVQRNSPYGAEDGVTHTLKLHGVENGLLNVMLEIRNDLIATADQQEGVAKMLAELLGEAVANVRAQSPSEATAC